MATQPNTPVTKRYWETFSRNQQQLPLDPSQECQPCLHLGMNFTGASQRESCSHPQHPVSDIINRRVAASDVVRCSHEKIMEFLDCISEIDFQEYDMTDFGFTVELQEKSTEILEKLSKPGNNLRRVWSRDPFYVAPLHKAFYHPSREKDVSKKKKQQAVLSADWSADQDQTSPAVEDFLKSTGTYMQDLPHESLADNSSRFDESWPVTERPSSLSLPGVSPSTGGQRPSEAADAVDSIKSKLDFTDEPVATLSKYIERFRKAPPMSRAERQKLKEEELLWVKEGEGGPSDSSTPRSQTQVETHGRRSSNQDRSGSPILSKTALSELSHKSKKSEAEGSRLTRGSRSGQSEMSGQGQRSPSPHSKDLQERTDRLLEQAESSLSSGGIVSTVGLGSSPSADTTIEEQPYRPSFTRLKPVALGKTSKDDDILYQWRTRRRLEQARGASATVKLNSDVEGRLAEFRKRLSHVAGEEHGPARMTSLMGHTTLLSQRKSVEIQTDQDLPADKNKATETETQTSTQKETEIQTEIHTDTDQDTDQHIEVASPQLVRKREKVAPHLHLSCDIIPCPHALNNIHFSNTEKYIEKIPDTETKHHHSDDSDFEAYKKEHLRTLHKEIEETLYGNSKDSRYRAVDVPEKETTGNGTENRRGCVDSHADKKTETDVSISHRKSNKKYDENINLVASSQEFDTDKSSGFAKERNKRYARFVGSSQEFDGVNTSAERRTSAEMRIDVDSSRDFDSVDTRSSSDFEDRVTKTKHRRQKQKENRGKQRHEKADGKIKNRTKRTKDTVDLTNHDTSVDARYANEGRSNANEVPATQSLGSAIGQVVSERLFEEDAHKDSSTAKKTIRPPLLQELEALVSDEEQFPEDEILQELRMKRKYFLHKLQAIDNLLFTAQDPTRE